MSAEIALCGMMQISSALISRCVNSRADASAKAAEGAGETDTSAHLGNVRVLELLGTLVILSSHVVSFSRLVCERET